MAVADWRSLRLPFGAGRLVDTGAVKLWFHDAGGDGDPLFLLGGWTAGHFQFDFVRSHLAGFQLLTWEPRGMGPSDCPDPGLHRYDLDVLSDDLRDLLDEVGIPRVHLWAGGFASYHALRFAARHPGLVGAVVTYNDVWAGDPQMAYDRIWVVYRTIVEQFGTTGLGARMLAGSFGVSDPPWFHDWETANIEEASHPETVEALVGFGCLHADVRDDLASITAPVLVLRGGQGWGGSDLAEGNDPSLELMRERLPTLEVATVPGAHPGYVVVQRPRECAAIVDAFLGRHPLRRGRASRGGGGRAVSPGLADPETISLAEIERLAKDALDPATYAFFACGAGDERALAHNRTAFARLTLRPRVLRDVGQRSTRTSVLGRDVSFPVLVAPVGFQTLLHRDGELATARGAARSETIMCVSTISEATPTEIAAHAPGARLWYQIYCLRDRELTADLIRQAAEAGFEAIVLTVDGPVLGRRDRAVEAGFRFPERFRVRSTARSSPAGEAASPAELAALIDPSLSWDDLEWIVSTAGLPLVLKGILTAEDARLACEHGASAIVVSNHGGRQLDAAPASLDALPEVVAAVGGEIEVMVDGGIRRGTDVLISLALGARAVLVGRPVIWGLVGGGEDGVARVLRLLRDEFDTALALCGCCSPEDVVPAMVAEVLR